MPTFAPDRDVRGHLRDGFTTGPEAHSYSRTEDTDFGLPAWLEDHVNRVAGNTTTVLLGGETGTGKTRLARLIHDRSPRRHLPFLVVNCAALSENLIESEMFGHVRGAFTGADRDRTGKFLEVGAGTLFLDEIDSLPGSVQAKLLRVIEDRMFEAVGSNQVESFRARLIAASNLCLEREVAAGRFRADLFYRLNVITFELPPLRERRPSIPTMAEAFLAEFSRRDGRAPARLDADALQLLTSYRWPGNIRELRNVLERAWVLRQSSVITREELPLSIVQAPEYSDFASPSPASSIPARAAMDSGTLAEARDIFEREQILQALREHNNNRSRVARNLGISRVTLYKKLHKHGIGLGPNDIAWGNDSYGDADRGRGAFTRRP